jgi:hypothetical protein
VLAVRLGFFAGMTIVLAAATAIGYSPAATLPFIAACTFLAWRTARLMNQGA